jgi:uncharacterized protein (TIGR03437 family)
MLLSRSRWLTALLFISLAAPVAAIAQDECPLERQVRLTVQSSPFPALPGQSVKFNIFIEPVTTFAEPTGTVNIFDDDADLGSATLRLAQTSLTRTFSTAGTHVLRVIYNGDFNYCAALTSYGQAVDRITPTVAVSSAAPTATYGSLLSLTATVGPAAPAGVANPAGPVQFFDSGTLIGAADLVSGKAALTTAALDSGTHQISATLIGDANWYSVRSTPVALTITPAPTTTRLTGNATTTDVTLSTSINSADVLPQSGGVQIVDTANNTVLGAIALPIVSLTLPIANVPVGHPIVAVYSGTTNYTRSTSAPVSLGALINAAGGLSSNVAPDEIVSLFGAGIANTTLTNADAATLPLTLGGIAVNITDKSGNTRQAGLYLVSPAQINFVVPAAVVSGPATISVSGANLISLQTTAATVAPGLFNPGVQVLRVAPDGSQTAEAITTQPITIGPGPTYLVLYGTGLRHRSSESQVKALIGNITLPVTYAGPQPQFPGLDQVDILLPASLQSAGKVNLTLTVDSQPTNSIALQFQ